MSALEPASREQRACRRRVVRHGGLDALSLDGVRDSKSVGNRLFTRKMAVSFSFTERFSFIALTMALLPQCCV